MGKDRSKAEVLGVSRLTIYRALEAKTVQGKS
jgi:hypothetical protein